MQIKDVVLHLLNGLNQYIENTGTLSSSMSLMHTKWDVLVHLQQEKRSIFVCCCFDERCRRHWVKEKKREKERDGKVAFCGRQMRRSNDCHVNSAEGGRRPQSTHKTSGWCAYSASLLTVDTHGSLAKRGLYSVYIRKCVIISIRSSLWH